MRTHVSNHCIIGTPSIWVDGKQPPIVKHIDLLNLDNMEFPMKSYHMVQYYKHADSNPRVFIAPSKYIQGPGYSYVYLWLLGVVKYLGDYICSISPLKKDRSCLLLCSEGGIRRFGAKSTDPYDVVSV